MRSGNPCFASRQSFALSGPSDCLPSAKLSHPRDHARHSLCAGRQHLDRRPRHRRQDERVARRKGRGRQPPRRRRHRRHQGGRQERARRLHAGARLYRHAGDRAVALQKCRLRSAQGFCADRPDRQCAEFAGGASVVPGQDRGRADRLCQGQSRQGQFRLRRRRHGEPYHRRIFCPLRRHHAGAYSLQGHRSGADRSAGRPHPDGVRADPGVAPQRHRGLLRALAVTSTTRSSLLPDVPTMVEAGLPGFDASLYYGLAAPPARRGRSSTSSTRRCATRSPPTR